MYIVRIHRRGRGLSEKHTFAYEGEVGEKHTFANLYVRDMTAAIHLTAQKIQ